MNAVVILVVLILVLTSVHKGILILEGGSFPLFPEDMFSILLLFLYPFDWICDFQTFSDSEKTDGV
jgi:hypothetical protein